MSVTAVGVLLNLDGPLPVERQYTLLNFPGVLREQVGEEEPEARWMNGVNVWGYPDGQPHTWEPCTNGTERAKSSGRGQILERFDPFTVYYDLTCSSISIGDPVEFEARAERAMNATLAFGIESALANGVAFSTNPYLADSNMVVLASGNPVSPKVGFGYLEDAIANSTARQGMIHATPSIISASGIPGAGFLQETKELYTPAGTALISGAGYIGAHPVGQSAPSVPGQGSLSWMFATGPVEIRLGAGPTIDTITIKEALHRSDNIVTFRAERYVLCDWDTALQVGVLVDWSM